MLRYGCRLSNAEVILTLCLLDLNNFVANCTLGKSLEAHEWRVLLKPVRLHEDLLKLNRLETKRKFECKRAKGA